jgi:hypothetical protein
MPVDMVLAISHNRMTMERCRVRLERKNSIETIKNIVDNVVYDKHVSNDLSKQHSCLEMFRLW